MKTALIAAIAAAAILAAAPGYAATRTAAPADTTVTPLPAASDNCPVMTPTPALSETAQGLFAVIANLCKLRQAGLIEDYQFQMIRDQAVNDLMAEMQADANERMNKSLALVP